MKVIGEQIEILLDSKYAAYDVEEVFYSKYKLLNGDVVIGTTASESENAIIVGDVMGDRVTVARQAIATINRVSAVKVLTSDFKLIVVSNNTFAKITVTARDDVEKFAVYESDSLEVVYFESSNS